MGINISHTNGFQFENRDELRNAAKRILNNSNSSKESIQNILDKTIFTNDSAYSNTQLAMLNVSAQISANKSLKETLKYLKSRATQKHTKKPVFGELWELFSDSNNENISENELLYFEIDSSAENIFAAA